MKPEFDREIDELGCSVARTLHIIGERWTLLILRDLLVGITRYDELQRDLGVASNVLATRLKHLVDYGIVEKTVAEDDARVYRYSLSEKGRELYPILLALLGWGDKWVTATDKQPILVVHKTCGHVTAAVPTCSVCHKPLGLSELTFAVGPGGKAVPGAARIGSYLADVRK